GEISGQQTRISATGATGTVTNRGLIDGQLTQLFAPTFHNLGSGRLYGDTLAIAVGTLLNDAEDGKAPVIAARERLDIGVQTLDNREHALIFSAGNLAIGGALDPAGHATGQATAVNNASATIEALGNLDLSTRSLRNTNEHFSTRIVEIARESIRQFQLSGSPNRYDPAQVSITHDEVDYLRTPEGRRDDWNRYDIIRTTTETQVATSDPGQILAGADMRLTADSVLNDKSRIIAGGLLQADLGTLTNTEVAGRRTITDSGTVTHFYRIQRKGRDDQGRSTSAYRPAATIQDIALQPTVYAQNTAPSGSATQLDARAISTIEEKAAGANTASVTLGQSQDVGTPLIRTSDAPNVTGLTRVPDNGLFRT
ncbi:MAG: adhesin, partial [Pseudomonas indica]|nr:adhesin [Pseudomonas indica]